MGQVVDQPVDLSSGSLVVVSRRHRVYLGQSRAGDYAHVVAPAQTELTDVDGVVVRPIGALACNCRGGVFHGRCYRLDQAEAHERGATDGAEEAWFGGRAIAPESELEKAAARG